ncbi:MAG: hypothetical protein KDE14_13295, partial [Rhodobacteraceae bacterium]|nr:hypothetical protein [Paracoccaceae bacterium]
CPARGGVMANGRKSPRSGLREKILSAEEKAEYLKTFADDTGGGLIAELEKIEARAREIIAAEPPDDSRLTGSTIASAVIEQVEGLRRWLENIGLDPRSIQLAIDLGGAAVQMEIAHRETMQNAGEGRRRTVNDSAIIARFDDLDAKGRAKNAAGMIAKEFELPRATVYSVIMRGGRSKKTSKN